MTTIEFDKDQDRTTYEGSLYIADIDETMDEYWVTVYAKDSIPCDDSGVVLDKIFQDEGEAFIAILPYISK